MTNVKNFDMDDLKMLDSMRKYAEKLEMKRYNASIFMSAKKQEERFDDYGRRIHGILLDLRGMTGRIVNMTPQGQLVFGDGSRSLFVDWLNAKKKELGKA